MLVFRLGRLPDKPQRRSPRAAAALPRAPFAPFLNDVFRLCRHPNGKTRIFSQINYNPPPLDLSILYLKKVQNILQTDEICQFFAYFAGVRPVFARSARIPAPRFVHFVHVMRPFHAPPCPSFYAPFSIFMSSRVRSASFPSSSRARSSFVIPNHTGALFSKRARVCEGFPRKEQTPWRFLIAARGNDGRRRRRQQGGGSLFEGAAEDTEAEGVVKIQPLLPSAALAADTSLHEGGIIPSRLYRNDAGRRFCAHVLRFRAVTSRERG